MKRIACSGVQIETGDEFLNFVILSEIGVLHKKDHIE